MSLLPQIEDCKNGSHSEARLGAKRIYQIFQSPKKGGTKLICPKCPVFRFYRKDELCGDATTSKIGQTTHSNKNNDGYNNDNI